MNDPFEAILTRYAEGPGQLEAALAGLSELDLDLALSADSWSIRQIVQHIADGDDIWKICIKAALGNPEGCFTLQWYWDKPQTEWAENWAYNRREIESSLALLRANRRHILELLEGLPQASERSIRLQCPDGHEERISIADVLEIQAQHVPDHIQDILKIRETHHL